jgi:phage baseplate assembly protein gpV
VNPIDELFQEIATLKARIANIVRPARITSFDAQAHAAVVDAGDGMSTHPLPLLTRPGLWSPPAAGEMATLLCPDGDVANGLLIPGGYKTGDARPSQRGDEEVLSRDGAALRVRAGGLVRAEVVSRQKFKIVIGGQAFAIRAEALEPVSND